MKKQTKVAAAKQVIASQTKVAAAALKQMQAAEAKGDMEVAVVAAEKLMDATHAAAVADGDCLVDEEYASMMENLGCTVGERSGCKFYRLPISDAVLKEYRAKNGQK